MYVPLFNISWYTGVYIVCNYEKKLNKILIFHFIGTLK